MISTVMRLDPNDRVRDMLRCHVQGDGATTVVEISYNRAKKADTCIFLGLQIGHPHYRRSRAHLTLSGSTPFSYS